MTIECSLTNFNVISSRVRLARNVQGLPFPRSGKSGMPEKMLRLVYGAKKSADKLFESELLLMSRLNKLQRMSLVEKHLISLPLANNLSTGAVIIQRGAENMSIMLNEEDHVREQCVVDGFDLNSAYNMVNEYDDCLLEELPIAYDSQFGFLTACPTNIGTGMRASTMLFLPALKLAGAIDDAVRKFTEEYGLTIRGVFGEGSSAHGDMYQLSNSRTLGIDEKTILEQVSYATEELCFCERKALEKLASEKSSFFLDKICRSYGILKFAYSISSKELMSLISDVKLGVILDVLPLKSTRPLDKLIWLASPSSLTLKIGEVTAQERDILRARLVRNLLSEDKW